MDRQNGVAHPEGVDNTTHSELAVNQPIRSSLWDAIESDATRSLQCLIDALPDPVVIKDAAHRWVAVNAAVCALAGDALQALAFQLLAQADEPISAQQRLRMIQQLSIASGSRGMVGGQAIDLAAVGQALTELELEQMHIHKTGALIRSSVLLAAYTAPDLAERQLIQLDHYAKCLGLAFQVQDDILDIESDTQTLGKTRGADAAAGKPTYPSVMGMSAAKRKLD